MEPSSPGAQWNPRAPQRMEFRSPAPPVTYIAT